MTRKEYLETEQPERQAFPPRADEVSYCPPHHWLVLDTYEECKKCGDQRQIWSQPAPLRDPLAALGEPTHIHV